MTTARNKALAVGGASVAVVWVGYTTAWWLYTNTEPTPFVYADRFLLSRPMAFESVDVPGHGRALVIQPDDNPSVATRCLHDAFTQGSLVLDRRFNPPRIYATRALEGQ